MSQESIAQRRIQERLDRLAGERGDPMGRAVTMAELQPLLERIASIEASLRTVKTDSERDAARSSLSIESNLPAFIEAIAQAVEVELQSEELDPPPEPDPEEDPPEHRPDHEDYNVLRSDVGQVRESTVRILSALRRVSSMLSQIIRQSR